MRFGRRFVDSEAPVDIFTCKEHHMDSSNLFSHPEAPERVASKEASAKPVENPKFSDRPDTQAGVPANR